jgi:hypothetical protein
MLNKLYKIYFSIPSFEPLGKLGKGINRFQDIYVFKPLLEKMIPPKFNKEFGEYGLNTKKRDNKIIFSLTSFPARINESWVSIECLMRQIVKADKIILWLAQSQFKNTNLPKKILELKERGLTIRFCDDLKSHKKYFYVMQENPDAKIITFDDDLYYDNRVVENLLKIHHNYPNSIAASRAHLMTFNQLGLMPYTKWKHNVTISTPSFELFHTSGAGTLFPPNLFHSNTFRKDLLLKLSPNSDDVWLKIMSFLSDIKVVTNSNYNKDWITVGSTQSHSLVSLNTKKGAKDKQLKKVMEHFGVKATNNKLQKISNDDHFKVS